MILTLIGLILTFMGSIILIADAYVGFRRPKPIFFPIHGKENKVVGYHREKKVEEGYKEVKILWEEIVLIIALSLISLGFLLQITDYLLQNFPQFFQFS